MSKIDRLENWIIVFALVFTVALTVGTKWGQNIMHEKELQEIESNINSLTKMNFTSEEIFNDNFMLDYISKLEDNKLKNELINILKTNPNSVFSNAELLGKCLNEGCRVIEGTEKTEKVITLNWRVIVSLVILSLIIAIINVMAGTITSVLVFMVIILAYIIFILI